MASLSFLFDSFWCFCLLETIDSVDPVILGMSSGQGDLESGTLVACCVVVPEIWPILIFLLSQ